MKRAVITGMGAITPLGNNVQTTWDNLLQGKSGAVSMNFLEDVKVRIGCPVKEFDPATIQTKQSIKRLSQCSQYALAAAIEAVKKGNFLLLDPDIGSRWGPRVIDFAKSVVNQAEMN